MSLDALKPRFLPDRHSQTEWGGKGAPLARMIRKGFAVPPTSAMGITQVGEWLRGLAEWQPALEAWRSWGAAGGNDARVKLALLEQAVLEAPMPAHWPESGATLRKFLCGDTPEEREPWPMILRSSMSAEDGSGASLAGCFESVVVRETTPEKLWEGFRQVVASAFRNSSAERLLASGVDPARLGVGVVIQPYLNAALAGVCFSRDPSDPWSRDGRVEWVQGQGEALVQGTAESRSRRRSEGPGDGLEAFWETLWKRAEKAEQLIGGPADLEWVWDGRQLWFVQLRPIATEEARLAARSPGRRWTRALTLERFPEPLTPMGWSVLQDAFVVNLKTLDRRFGVVARHPEDMAVCVRGTVYSDPRFFAFPSGVSIRWSKYLNPFSAALWRAGAALARYLGRMTLGRSASVSKALLRVDLVQALLGPEAARIEQGWDAHREKSVAALAGLEPSIAGAEGEARVLDRMAALTEVGAEFMEPDLAVFLVKDALNKAVLGVCQALGWTEAAFVDLFRGFEGNRTLEMNAEWNACIERIARDPRKEIFLAALEERTHRPEGALGDEASASWREFLARNGHSTTTWDIAAPSWAEDPAQLAPLIRAALAAGTRREVVTTGLRERKRDELFVALKRHLTLTARGRLARALERLESFMRIDEEHHFLSGLLLSPSRKLILAGGRCLARQGLIARAEDVFFVSLPELKAALSAPGSQASLRPVVERRRSEWQRARRSVPSFELPAERSEAQGASPAAAGEPNVLQGSPMSPGVVTGRAVVAEHLDQVAGIEPGAILITTSPNPALTPLFPLLGGLVSATGGALSHGFVSAREYALPAVSGINRVTEKIPPGALVRVDGGTGRVEVLQ